MGTASTDGVCATSLETYIHQQLGFSSSLAVPDSDSDSDVAQPASTDAVAQAQAQALTRPQTVVVTSNAAQPVEPDAATQTQAQVPRQTAVTPPVAQTPVSEDWAALTAAREAQA